MHTHAGEEAARFERPQGHTIEVDEEVDNSDDEVRKVSHLLWEKEEVSV
jgi:hypothetical protein